MSTPKKSTPKPAFTPNQQKIIRDLAHRIENRAAENYKVKAGNIRARLLEVMESAWPNSAPETLAALAVKILSNTDPDETAIMAEIRELNQSIVPSERKLKPCPFEDHHGSN